MMLPEILLYILLFFSFFTIDSFAVTPPQDRRFPRDFRLEIDHDSSVQHYGDPGWVNKMQKRKQIREDIALEKIAYEPLPADNFVVPVLLGKYSDKTTSYNAQDFQNQLFGNNPTGSLTEYYKEVSYNQFTLTGKAYGWFTLDNTQSYYSSDNYGNNKSNFPRNGDGFVYDVVEKADPTVDFSQYDNDGQDGIPNSGDDDGYVDAVITVCPGRSPACANVNENLLPVMGRLGDNKYTTNDQSANGGMIIVNAFTICSEISCDSELINEVGVFAHEFGHVLGLPDLYDRTGDSVGIGEWCLMAAGGWGGDGDHPEKPAHFSAWCKLQLGWVTPIILTHDTTGLTIHQVETNPEIYMLWEDVYQSSRYFLIENRQKVGFDTYLNGSGLLIFHVDEHRSFGPMVWSFGINNDDETHKLVDLEEADGRADLDTYKNRGDNGDPFPGSSMNYFFNDATDPSSKDYHNQHTGIEINNISNSGPIMTADITVRNALGYTIEYDENGISDWGWGENYQTDSWGGVLFTTLEAGILTAIDIGIRKNNTYYEIKIFDSFEDSAPKGLLKTISGYAQIAGWYSNPITDTSLFMEENENFFVSLKIENKTFGVPFDYYGELSGRSYASDDGYTFDSFTYGDINIRTRINTSIDISTIGTLSGTITDSRTGAGIPSATVTVNNGYYFSTLTDTNGEYHLEIPAGTYTVTVTSPDFETQQINNITIEANQIQTVNLQLTPNDFYEPNNNRDNAFNIVLSNHTWNTEKAAISSDDDQDWFQFNGNAGDAVSIICDVTSELDAELVLYNNNRRLESSNTASNGGDETIIDYHLPEDGIYHIGIGYWAYIYKIAKKADITGAYTLSVTITPDSDPYEPNNTRENAFQISFKNNSWTSEGTNISLRTDQDWFQFNGNAGDVVSIICDVTSELNAELVLYNNNRRLESSNTSSNGGDETITDYILPENGTYYIGIGYWAYIYKIAKTADFTGTYSLSITITPDIDPYEPNNSRETAYQVSFINNSWYYSEGANISLKTDQDWFKFNGNSSDVVSIICDVTSDFDAELVLYNNNRRLESRNTSSSGGDETITDYTLQENGIYYIGIGHWSSIYKIAKMADYTGSYELRITKHSDSGEEINNQPVIITTKLPDATQGVFYSFALSVENPDVGLGDSFTFMLLEGPEWLSVDILGILKGTPLNDDVGISIPISIIVQNTIGLSDTLTTTINVINVLDPPLNFIISDIPNDNGHRLQLTWDLSPDDDKGYISWYRIYRSRSDKLTEPIPLNQFTSIDSLIVWEEHYTILIDSVAVGTTEYFDEYVHLNGVSHYYWLQAVGSSGESEKVAAYITIKTIVENTYMQFFIKAPYPNPFNPTTTIEYYIPYDTPVTLAIYNVSGQLVAVLKDEMVKAGYHSLLWNAVNMPSGIYFCSLEASGFFKTQKLLLMK